MASNRVSRIGGVDEVRRLRREGNRIALGDAGKLIPPVGLNQPNVNQGLGMG